MKTPKKKPTPKRSAKPTPQSAALQIVTVKMPPVLVEQINSQAKAAYRTRSAQILYLIELGMKNNKPQA